MLFQYPFIVACCNALSPVHDTVPFCHDMLECPFFMTCYKALFLWLITLLFPWHVRMFPMGCYRDLTMTFSINTITPFFSAMCNALCPWHALFSWHCMLYGFPMACNYVIFSWHANKYPFPITCYNTFSHIFVMFFFIFHDISQCSFPMTYYKVLYLWHGTWLFVLTCYKGYMPYHKTLQTLHQFRISLNVYCSFE